MRISSIIDISLVDVPGVPVTVIFTGGCNFDCPYCQNSALIPLDSGETMSPSEVARRVSGFLSEGFCITGGEPTIHRDLPDLLRALRELSPKHVNLNTQGSVPGVLRASLPYLDSVWFDLKAPPARYREISRTKSDPWPRVLRSFRMLRDSDVQLWPRTTYVGGLMTREDLLGILDVLVSEGYEGPYHIQNYVHSDGVREDEARRLTRPAREDVEYVARTAPPEIRVHIDWR